MARCFAIQPFDDGTASPQAGASASSATTAPFVFNELEAFRVPVSTSGAVLVPLWCRSFPGKSPISPRSFTSMTPPNLPTFPPAPSRSRILYIWCRWVPVFRERTLC
jgi:hypothetical protein